MINYVLTAIACYLGLLAGFILSHFAKQELKKIKKRDFWFIKKSELFYVVFAAIFYLAKDYEFFDSVASSIFIYGVAVGALSNENKLRIITRNSFFIIAVIVLLLLKL